MANEQWVLGKAHHTALKFTNPQSDVSRSRRSQTIHSYKHPGRCTVDFFRASCTKSYIRSTLGKPTEFVNMSQAAHQSCSYMQTQVHHCIYLLADALSIDTAQGVTQVLSDQHTNLFYHATRSVCATQSRGYILGWPGRTTCVAIR